MSSRSPKLARLKFKDIAWLFGVGPPNEIAIPPAVLDDIVLKFWHLGPTILLNVARARGAASLTLEQRDFMSACTELAKLQLQSSGEISAILQQHEFPHVMMKGIATSILAYPNGARCVGDFDVGLESRRALDAHRALRRNGFVQCGYDAARRRYEPVENRAARRAEKGHYELCMLVRERSFPAGTFDDLEWNGRLMQRLSPMIYKRRRLIVYCEEVDIHRGLFLDLPCTDMVNTADSRLVGDIYVPFARIEHLFLHVLMKLYIECIDYYGKGAHQFVDLLRLSQLISPKGWRWLSEQLIRLNMVHAGYYVLRRLSAHGAVVPGAVRSRLRVECLTVRSLSARGVDPEELNDYGDFWERVMWLDA